MSLDTSYDANSIKVLTDVDHCRQRPGMYVGDMDNPRQLLSEVFDNAIDEVQAGFSKELIVSVDTEVNMYTVRDFGRGIPHGTKKLENGEEKEILEVLCTKSFSGGKYDNNSYNFSSGLNGVGMVVTNALSEYYEVSSYRGDNYVSLQCDYGKVRNLIKGKFSNEHLKPYETGTEVKFIPDKSLYKNSVIPLKFIEERCRIASALGYRARLIIDGVEIDTNATMYDLIKENEEDNISIYQKVEPIIIKLDNGELMKVVLEYTSDTSDRYFGFTNMLSNSMGGTHVQELSKTIISTWRDYIDKGRIKTEVELRNSDFLIGLRAVCAVFIAHPEFSSQTKEKLTVPKQYFKEHMEKFKEQFMTVLYEDKNLTKALLKRFEEYRIAQNKLLARKEISSIIKINSDNPDNIRRRSVVSKLVECTSKKRDNTELFIVEGNSAMGPYLSTRNKELQAVLPLRGKILNITYKNVKDAIKNKEICDIANSIGCGIGSACDATKSRYEKVIISADADPDGLQINCLVLSVFINMFPDMVKQGRVFLTTPPLYCWGDNVKNYGWCNKVDEIPKNVKNVHRFKGLGEMNSDQLEFFLVNPETRNLIQVDYPSNVDRFNRILGTAVGRNELMKDLGIIEEE